jgi:AraC-like DNA-binding protein
MTKPTAVRPAVMENKTDLPSDPPLPQVLQVDRRPDGETFVILPPKVQERVARHPLMSGLWFVSGGYYPHARMLVRDRPQGCAENLLIYCAEGGARVVVDGVKHIFGAGEFLLIPANMSHSYEPDEAAPWSIHWVSFLGANARLYSEQLPAGRFILPVDASARLEVEGLFTRIHKLLRESLSDSHLICASKDVESLLALLLFRHRQMTEDGSGSDPLAAAVRRMHENLYTTVTLEELAEAAGLSKSHFTRLFGERMGMAPIDYFIRLKMQRACQYLDTTDWPLKQVAAHMGYPDAAYFSRVFSKVMEMTARDYRRGAAARPE